MEILEDLPFTTMADIAINAETTIDMIMIIMVLKIIIFPLRKGVSTTGGFMEELMETVEVIRKPITMIIGDLNSTEKGIKAMANITTMVNYLQ